MLQNQSTINMDAKFSGSLMMKICIKNLVANIAISSFKQICLYENFVFGAKINNY